MALEVNLIGVNNGIYKVAVIKDDEYIGPTIASGNEWNGWMRPDIEKYYKPGTDIIDVGANIGYNTLMFSDYGPVHSFEPVYYQIVDININNNNLKNNVYIYNSALSNEEREDTMYIPERGCANSDKKNYGETSLIKQKEKIGNKTIDVKCQRLDDVYTGTPSIIKIDVEGHELQMLEGAVNIIKTNMPTILIEICDYENSEIPKFLKDLGYDEPEKRPEHMFLYRAKDIFSTM